MIFSGIIQKISLGIFFLAISYCSSFSQTGSIRGVVKENGTGETIIGANVVIDGTTTGTSTDLDGKFEISNLVPGSYTLKITYISYETKIIENITVYADHATEISSELKTVANILGTFEVVERLLREKESILLLEQKKSAEIVQYIGSQELTRKGIGDVATAVTKVTGITKIEGSDDVFVRGLGDRYNSTQMNGLPMPSNNPEQKNISLSIFSTDIVEYISIDKVYNNRIYGDFAGGNVDIISRDFTGDRFLSIETGSSFNMNSAGEGKFPLKSDPGYFGLHTSSKPGSLETFNFENSMNPVFRAPAGSNFSLKAGNSLKTGKQKSREISFFTTVNFENEFATKEGIARNVNSGGIPTKDFVMKTWAYNTTMTALLNTGFSLNKNHKIHYNFLFINSSENETEQYTGLLIDIANDYNGLLIRRNYERNSIFINQLVGEHKPGLRTGIQWGVSYNSVSSDVPDRIQNTFVMKPDGDYFFGQNQITDNHRYYHYLNEHELSVNFLVSYKFLTESALDYRVKLTLGGTGRIKNREFNATQFNFRIASGQRETIVDPNNTDAFFNQQNLENGYFRIETFRGNYQVPKALDPQVYTGEQIIEGAYITTEYKSSKKLTTLFGLRGEYIFQGVKWNTQLDPQNRSDYFEKISFLPNITAKYELNKKQNIRFGASKTYTLPQFKERVLFIYEEVTQVKIGNPDLYPSDNYNADLKWEMFPGSGEILSLGVYGKYILNPINEVTISSATNDISFLNTGSYGYVTGAEFETRKELISNNISKLSFGFNASYMITGQELNSEKVKEETIFLVNFTNEKSRFTGASDLLINSDITYTYYWNENKNTIQAALSHSYFSDRIYAIGTNSRGNIIEKPFHSIDLNVKAEFKKISAVLGFKNLLNPSIERFQANSDGDVPVLSYKKGMTAGFKITYHF